MNKQELIKRIGQLFAFGSRDYIERDRVLELVKQLDEPQPVKVKQFVADWIEHCRGLGYSLYQAMELVHENAEIKKWFIFVDNQDLFARAWLDGYEVEKEKRYLVKFKGVYHGDLGYAINFGGYSFYCKERSLSGIRFTHTHKELEEADFGWVFNCEGVEIEEVID